MSVHGTERGDTVNGKARQRRAHTGGGRTDQKGSVSVRRNGVPWR